KKSRSDGYDTLALFSALLLSLAIHGKLVSLRDLEKECKYHVRFQMLLNGERPTYKTFERVINENLSIGIEELLKKLN
ncbi:transposase, partial [[Clostridium] innocuum]|uniref:transposase n=1 Tax=Clostridium innocuum TaxID=1522 RepID=UPI0021089CF5